MSYIVRNCPAILKTTLICDDFSGSRCTARPCKDITDCVMKQIVENLKTCLQDNTCDNCDGIGYYDGCQDVKCGDYQARKSLELLEIEECEC